MTAVRLGPGAEFDLIRRFIRNAAPSPLVTVPPGDDCAVFAAGSTAISVDMSVEGVHFRRDWLDAEEIGWRAAAAALSDLAAMAAAPFGMLVSLGVPAADADTFAPRIMDGCRAAADACGAALIGGDFTRAPAIVIDVVVLGAAERPALRSTALPGDELWVTGTLGGAAAAVRAWERQQQPPAAARAAFAQPLPRTAEARWLHEHDAVAALIDISDGLAGDAAHIAAASNVRITLHAGDIPVHPAVRDVAADDDDALRIALGGGEDYELCVAARPGAIEPLRAAFEERFGIGLTRVGSIDEGGGVLLERDGTTSPITFGGFDHVTGAAP